MPSISVTYLGLKLSSPLVVSSSNLTHDVSGARRAQAAGAGAIVLKSLFEEQIEHDTGMAAEDVDFGAHPEAAEYIGEMSKQLGPADYIGLIGDVKSAIDIPVIASVNCTSPRWWPAYGRQIEQAGADALELNIAMMPRGAAASASIEDAYVAIVRSVREQTSLPLSVKIGPSFTNLTLIASALAGAGADALVLFNRFYQLDIDPEKLELSAGYQFSAPEEIYTPLRWISILSGAIECELAASTGVYTSSDAVKMILAGATVVQLCSTLYKNGLDRLTEMNAELRSWMERHGFSGLDAVRGKLRQSADRSPERYERLQYIKALTGRA